MKAVVISPRQRNSIRLAELPLPGVKADEVLVKTVSVGIDATDLEIVSGIYGAAPDGQDYLVAGHEAVGQVVETGDKVTAIRKGDFVVPIVRASCGNCVPCQNDEPDMCQTDEFTERGIKGANGFLSDFFAEKEANLIKIPAQLAPFGALVEPFSVAEKAIEHCYKIQERFKWEPDRAMVFGAGSLGILICLSLRSKGIDTYVFDIEGDTSAKARAVKGLGATYIDGNNVPADDLIQHFERPDMVFDATGNSKVALSAIGTLNKSGIACLLGVTSGRKVNDICMDCLNDQLVMNNNVVFGSVSSNKRHFNKAASSLTDAVQKWPDTLDSIITNRLNLTDYRRAFQKDSELKTVIDLFD